MRTIKKEYNIYDYNELSKEAKEKVRNYFGINDIDIQTDMLKEDFHYQIEENHPYFENAKFEWSLSCGQGDGLSFSCSIDKEKFIEKYFPELPQYKKDALFNMIYNLHSKGNNGRYCYASESDIDYEIEPCYNGKFDRLENLIEQVAEKARQVYIEVCGEFEKQGYESYEYLYSDEYAQNCCEANEYEFTEEGEMV